MDSAASRVTRCTPGTAGLRGRDAAFAIPERKGRVSPRAGATLGPVRIGEASRRSFEDRELAERYADLVTWRDELYAAHRG